MFIYLNKRTGDRVPLTERCARFDRVPEIWECDDSGDAWKRVPEVVNDPNMIMLNLAIADYDELASTLQKIENRISEIKRADAGVTPASQPTPRRRRSRTTSNPITITPGPMVPSLINVGLPS